MKHIRSKDIDPTYTIVITDGYGEEGQPTLEQHPSILDYPNLYEIVDCEIPEHCQYLIYRNNNNFSI
mgnify:CR=1 FL=1